MTTLPTRPSLIRLGGWPFIITALAGRLPAAMIQLGILLFVTRAGGGLAQAGLAVACLGVGSAIGGPVVGWLNDRVRSWIIVLGATVVQVAALLTLADGVSGPTQLALGAVLGAANPQVGSVARSRWARLARDRQDSSLVARAMGWEGAADEISFVAGPAVGGVLIGALGARPGLLAIAAITVVGQLAFAGHLLASSPVRTRSTGRSATEPLPVLALLAPAVVVFAVGVTFGMTQTGLTARFDALGRPGLTGPVYALLGVGSALGSLAVGRLSVFVGPRGRLILGGAGIAASALALAWLGGLPGTPGLWAASVTTFLIGLAIGPVMVTAYGWAEGHAPRARLTTAMTVMSTGVVLGVSAGAGVGSRLVVAYGVQWALGLVVVAGVVAAVVAALWADRR